ncbi:MAG: GDP-mannose 4,6-dehydratase [Candidatus Saccharibacteria bacterium]|nr:GDP-mannose 4,6-dehydratase [Microbacteriaceae bacterium]
MTSALITGATGQDGSYLVEQLTSLGWQLHALTRQTAETEEQDLPEWVTPHLGDLGDPSSLSRVVEEVEPNIIFNLAGISSVPLSWELPELTVQVTGASVATLLESALLLQARVGRPVKVIQASSSEIFGHSLDNPQNESSAILPLSPYGASKALAHNLVRIYRSRDMFASNAILYNHESPRRPTSFVTRKITIGVARIARGRSKSLVLGNLDAERDWGWAPDYVDAMVRMARADSPGDFVVATGESHTVRQFVGSAFAAAGIDDWEHYIEVDERFKRPTDAPVMRGDSSHLRNSLGWKPTLDFDGLVSAMVRHDLGLLDD